MTTSLSRSSMPFTPPATLRRGVISDSANRMDCPCRVTIITSSSWVARRAVTSSSFSRRFIMISPARRTLEIWSTVTRLTSPFLVARTRKRPSTPRSGTPTTAFTCSLSVSGMTFTTGTPREFLDVSALSS